MNRDTYNYYSEVIKHVAAMANVNNVRASKIVKNSFFKKLLVKNVDITITEPPDRWANEILCRRENR